mgnify:CR=1 FL=1
MATKQSEFKDLVTQDVMRMLEGTPFAHVRHTKDTSSTNDDASAAMAKPDSAGLTIVAEHQRQGVGRKGRTWVDAPKTALLFTTILPVQVKADLLWAVPFWVALCIRIAVTRRYGKPLELQWPNDLLVGGDKVGGIMCTSRVRGDNAMVACGVGLNVHRPAEFKAFSAIAPPPAFLEDTIPDIKREPLLGEILRAFAANLKLLENPRMIALRWEAAASLDGTPYRLALDNGEAFEAVAQRLGPDGALIVKVGDEERTIHLADARVVR